MTDDIVARLRDKWKHSEEDCYEAADEIERLRTDYVQLERLWIDAIKGRLAERKKTAKIHSDEIERLRAENDRLRAESTTPQDSHRLSHHVALRGGNAND